MFVALARLDRPRSVSTGTSQGHATGMRTLRWQPGTHRHHQCRSDHDLAQSDLPTRSTMKDSRGIIGTIENQSRPGRAEGPRRTIIQRNKRVSAVAKSITTARIVLHWLAEATAIQPTLTKVKSNRQLELGELRFTGKQIPTGHIAASGPLEQRI